MAFPIVEAIKSWRKRFESKCALVFRGERGNLTTTLKTLLLCAAVLIVFQKFIVGLFSKVIVTPLLSTVHESIVIDIVFIGIVAYVYWKVAFAVWGKVRWSVSYLLIVIAGAVLYSYYRIIAREEFTFLSFSFSKGNIALLDIIYAILLLHLGYWGYRIYTQPLNTEINKTGFFVDGPIDLVKENDLLRRWSYVSHFSDLLINTSNDKYSFAVGIIGDWGSGKTTFIRGMSTYLKSRQDIECVIIDYNPWFTHRTKSTTETFFSTLAAELSVYDASLETKIQSYSNKLLAAIDEKKGELVKSIIGIGEADLQIKEQFDVLNKAISRLDKKVIVTIDDVDRLSEIEVVEILKIVRNTANFNNFYFIIAYDRSYVVSCITKVVNARASSYLDKIIQLEYYLPLNNNIVVLSNVFYDKLKAVVGDEDRKVIDALLPIVPDEARYEMEYQEFVPRIHWYLKTIREVNKLLNVVLVNYNRLERDIYLPDFIFVSIIKMKYPDVYNLLYMNKTRFFENSRSEHEDIVAGKMVMAFSNADTDDAGYSVLYNYLNAHKESYLLSDEERDDVCNMVNTLFNWTKHTDVRDRNLRTLHKNHLSICNGVYFDRYFDAYLEDRITEDSLNRVLDGGRTDVELFVSLIKDDRVAIVDMKLKLGNIKVDDLQTRNRHENMITMLFLLAYQSGLDGEILDRFLGMKVESYKDIIEKFYGNDESRLQALLFDLVVNGGEPENWSFSLVFTQRALTAVEHNDHWVFDKDSIKGMNRERMLKRLSSEPGYNGDLNMHMRQCFAVNCAKNRKAEKTEYRLTDADRALFIEFRKLIMGSDNASDFFVDCLYKTKRDVRNTLADQEPEGYFVSGWVAYVFGKLEEVEIALVALAQNEALLEFKGVFIAWKHNRMQPVPYEFKSGKILSHFKEATLW